MPASALARRRVIVASDSEQDAEALADLAAPATRSPAYSLDDRPHALVADVGLVAALPGPQRARELVVPLRLGVTPLLVEAAAERVVGVVVHRRDLEHGAELRLRLLPTPQPEVRDAERLADRRLPWLGAAGLLERDCRLRRPAAAESAPSFLVVLVRACSHEQPFDLVEYGGGDRGLRRLSDNALAAVSQDHHDLVLRRVEADVRPRRRR